MEEEEKECCLEMRDIKSRWNRWDTISMCSLSNDEVWRWGTREQSNDDVNKQEKNRAMVALKTYHVAKNVGGILENMMGVLSLDAGNETDTARVLLVLGVVKALSDGECTSPGAVAFNVVAVHEGLHYWNW